MRDEPASQAVPLESSPSGHSMRSMLAKQIGRRELLVAGGASLLLASCGQSAPSVPSAGSASAGGQGGPTAASANASVGASGAGTSAVTIRFQSYNLGAPGLGGKGTKQLIDEFQAAFPNIILDGKYVAAEDVLKSTVAQAAAGDPPEVAQISLDNLDFVVHNLPVQPIDTVVPKDRYDALMNHIVPTARNLGALDGHNYGSPFTISTPTLFYNADIFTAAGLDPAKPPTTWDEVRQFSQQIKDKTGKSALNIAALGAFFWLIQSLIESNGGKLLGPDSKTPMFNQAPAVDVYKMWQGLVADGLHPKLNANDATSAMSNGNLAMMLNTTATLPAFRDAANGKYDLRTAGEPAFTGKTVHPVNSGSALFMMTKDPQKQKAAWEFMNFAASQRGFTIITSVIGYLPLRDDVLDDPKYLKPVMDKDGRMLPTIKQLSNLTPKQIWPGQNSVQAVQLYMQALENVVYGGQDAQKTMDAAASRVADLLKA